MPRGLFELRKDAITGWWVAVVVDREFDRQRFYRPAKLMDQTVDHCPNCNLAAGSDRVQLRVLKSDAFIVAGTEREAREASQAGVNRSWAWSVTAVRGRRSLRRATTTVVRRCTPHMPSTCSRVPRRA
jgi:hypothetical protein